MSDRKLLHVNFLAFNWVFANNFLVQCSAEESERAAARLKGLDQPGPLVASNAKPHKDVNTFINNQLKFVGGTSQIPPDQMKCNILKAKADEQYRKGR